MARAPHRFHVPGQMELTPGISVALPEGESHHLIHVLRLRAGTAVIIFDSRGNSYAAEVEAARGKQSFVKVLESAEKAEEGHGGHEPGRSRLHVAVSLLKHRAMDWMIEKLCELDVASLQPLVCKRTVVVPGEGKADPPERWENIALAAAKQSGRGVPMSFAPVTPLDAWLRRERPPVLNCFAHKSDEAVGLGEWLSGRAGMGLPVQVAVGPEGGWTPGEVESFLKAGFMAVSLGPLVLRAETAAITVAAACRVML